MARTYKNRDIHTKPELAGEQNMTKAFIEKNKDVEGDNSLGDLVPVFGEAMKKRKRKTAWTPEQLIDEITNYFQYSADHFLKPSKSGLRLWLGCSRSQYHAWQSETAKYGDISDIINHANDVMETQYIQRGEKYPTMNVFLLKSSFGHEDKNTIEVQNANPNEIKDTISKLGLDKE